MAYKDKNAYSLWRQRKRIEAKQELISALGGKCEACGNEDPRVLQLDHRNNDGAEDRKKNKQADYLKFKWILEEENFKERYACLCANCHAIKTYETDGHAKTNRRYHRLDPDNPKQ